MEGTELILPTHYVDMEIADLEYRAGFSLGKDTLSILNTIGGAVGALAMMIGGLAAPVALAVSLTMAILPSLGQMLPEPKATLF